jgi:hypothetical protein
MHAIRKALLHIPTQGDIAVVTGDRVHDGGSDNDDQKRAYEKCIQPHNVSMVRHFITQSKKK